MTRSEPKLEHHRAQVMENDFLREIGARSAWAGMSGCEALGKAISVSAQSVCNYRKDPGKIKMETMQKLVKVLKPDIGIVLRFLGYSNQEIKRFAKEVLL